jgi:DNA-binding NtrC family response regulator
MSAQSGSLLIVDDEPDLRELLALTLANIAAAVHTASNGKEALEIIKTGTIDVVLSDINMPEMNGLELLAQVRDLGLDIPFIFVTGYADSTKCVQALRLGATDFLEKPFKKNQVVEIISNAMALSKAMRDVESVSEKLGASTDLVKAKESVQAAKRVMRQGTKQ